MITQAQLAVSDLRFMLYRLPDKYSDMIVAYAESTMIAVQYVSRYVDPRTGFRLTDKRLPSAANAEYAITHLLLYDMSQAIRLMYDPFSNQSVKDKARQEIDWALECHAKQRGSSNWALIVPTIPDPNTEPTIQQPKPKSNKGKAKKNTGFIPQVVTPAIGTEGESNEQG